MSVWLVCPPPLKMKCSGCFSKRVCTMPPGPWGRDSVPLWSCYLRSLRRSLWIAGRNLHLKFDLCVSVQPTQGLCCGLRKDPADQLSALKLERWCLCAALQGYRDRSLLSLSHNLFIKSSPRLFVLHHPLEVFQVTQLVGWETQSTAHTLGKRAFEFLKT